MEPSVDVKVYSKDGYGETTYRVSESVLFEVIIEKYAGERGLPRDSIVLTFRNGVAVAPKQRVGGPIKGGLVATITGLSALRSIFDLYDGGGGLPGPNLRPEVGNAVHEIVFGGLVMRPWHSSPYPRYLAPLLEASGGVLFVCDVCLRYVVVKEWMEHHIRAHGGCAQGSHPPGKQIFLSKNKDLAVWEVDGGIPYESIVAAKGLPSTYVRDLQTLRSATTRELFAQHLGLLSRFFLKGKTALYGPGAFLYYVLTEFEHGAWRFRGYFSKEKGDCANSLACITVLPPWQDRGYGRLLIHISYLLCKPKDGSLSEHSPERPLSDLGMAAFLSYWKGAILAVLHSMVADPRWQSDASRKGGKDIDHVVHETAIRRKDVVKVLHVLSLLTKQGSVTSEMDWEAAQSVRLVNRGELDQMAGGTFFGKPV
ncbi:Histone acetyltransferase Tip60-like protein [Diplonema papillatum]|nr:Histone acetyltransferase Tip60-like protein [Diplonema papillatum]